MAAVLAWLEAEGISGVGQSSWGPTGFGLVGAEAEAAALLAAVQPALACRTRASAFAISRGRNRGADIEVIHSAA